MIPIEVIYSDANLLIDLQADLRTHRLSEKFLYTPPASVSAWLKLCESVQYGNFQKSLRLLKDSLPTFVATMPEGKFNVVSLGPGEGSKDLLLAKALSNAHKLRGYYVVDVSEGFLRISLEKLKNSVATIGGFRADCCVPAQLRSVVSKIPKPRLFIILGTTLGGWELDRFLLDLFTQCEKGDLVLLDGEYFHPEVLQQYDNLDNRSFAFSPLRSLGISESNGELCFDLQKDVALGFYYVHKCFVPSQNFQIQLGSLEVAFLKGEKLEMSRSYKYDPKGFEALVKKSGYHLLGKYNAKDQHWFILLMSRPLS